MISNKPRLEEELACMLSLTNARKNHWITVRIISYWENLTRDKLHPLLLKVFKLGLHPPV